MSAETKDKDKTVWVEDALHRQVKAVAARDGLSVRRYIAQLIARDLAARAKKTGKAAA